VREKIPHGARHDDGLVDLAAAQRYDPGVSGKAEGAPDVEPHLTLPPTAAERLAALEAERDRERAAIRDLETKLAEAAVGRALLNESGRFRGMVVLGFSLSATLLFGILLFCTGPR
jgi:hypothetical protein